MSSTKRVGLLAGAAALSLSGVGFGDMNAENDALRNRVAELETRLASVEAQQGENWLTEARADEIRALVSDVLADANSYASLQGSGAMAGWDDGFYLASADGNYSLELSGMLQVRWAYHNNDSMGTDENRYGFENRRTQLIFEGHIVNPQWMYRIQGEFSATGAGTFGLLDAWIGYDYGNGWMVKAGQFKTPFARETLVYSGHQQGVERSLLENGFGLGRTQGAVVSYEADMWRMMASYNDGAGAANTASITPETDLSLSGRFEYLVAGNWGQFQDFASWRGEEFGLLLGVAGHFQSGERGTAATEVDVFTFTIDASAEFGGANLYGAFFWADLDPTMAGASSTNPLGFLVQGGWFFTEDWEVYGRFEWGDTDVPGSMHDTLAFLTIGVNKYWDRHNAKWSTEIGFAFDGIPAFFGDSPGSGDGITATLTDDDDVFVIRTQLQLLF